MRIVEKTLVILAVLGIILRLTEVPGGAVLLTFSVCSLSILYSVFGFSLLNGIRFRKIFKAESYRDISVADIAFGIVSGIILSAGVLTILFNLMHWAGAGILRYTMLVPLGSVCIVAVILSVKKSSTGKNILWRALPTFLLNLFFVLKYYYMF